MMIVHAKDKKERYGFKNVIEQKLEFGDYSFIQGTKSYSSEFIIKIFTFEEILDVLENPEKHEEEIAKGQDKRYYALMIESSPNKIFYHAVKNSKFYSLKKLYEWSIRFDFQLLFLGSDKEVKHAILAIIDSYYKYFVKRKWKVESKT